MTISIIEHTVYFVGLFLPYTILDKMVFKRVSNHRAPMYLKYSTLFAVLKADYLVEFLFAC